MVKKRQIWDSAYKVFITVLICVICIAFLINFGSPQGALLICWAKESSAFINSQAISNFGKYIAIGTNLGLLTVYDRTGNVILEKLFKDPILDVKFSYDESYVYVRSYSVYAVNIRNNSVSWEKFLKNYYVSDFFPFRDGRLGFLFASKTDLTNLYIYTDSKGGNIKQFRLPETYGRFKVITSPNGKYILFSTEDGNIYNIRYDGYVNWNTHLDPPVFIDAKLNYPLLIDINNDGFTCICYTFEQFGKMGNLLSFFDLGGKALWQKNFTFTISSLSFSPDGNKISITYSSYVKVFRTDGTTLFESYQYGYIPVFSALLPTKLLVFYTSKENSSFPFSSKGEIIRLQSIYNRKSLFQTKLNFKCDSFFSSVDGFYFFEISKPFLIRLYRYQQIK